MRWVNRPGDDSSFRILLFKSGDVSDKPVLHDGGVYGPPMKSQMVLKAKANPMEMDLMEGLFEQFSTKEPGSGYFSITYEQLVAAVEAGIIKQHKGSKRKNQVLQVRWLEGPILHPCEKVYLARNKANRP